LEAIMAVLPFSMPVMEYLADHRSDALTFVFRVATDLGEVQGYLLITTLIYVMVDKRLAVRLAMLVSLTMCLNHLLKIVIQNPRPFILEGEYLQRWAVPLDTAHELALEFSTPSGHAMAAAAFYTCLFGWVANRTVRTAAVVALLLIGASRPYLGVHYVEDVLLGWAIGLGVGLATLLYADRLGAAWGRLSHGQQIGAAVAASMALWVGSVAINGGRVDVQPRAFLGYAGAFTGIVIAWPLELLRVDFDPKSKTAAFRLARFVLTLVLALVALLGVEWAFDRIAVTSTLGYLLQYLRHAAVSVVGLFVAPWVFTAIGLADRKRFS
jgi:membrane-associated phospholipid phosphatase